MGPDAPVGQLVGASLHPAELEDAYRARFLPADSRLAVAALGILAILGETSALNDARFVADPAVRARLDAVRVLFFLASVVLGIVLLRSRRAVVADRTFLAWAALGSAFNVAVQSTRPSGYFMPIVESISYVFMLWTMTTGRLAVQALSAAFATTAAATWMIAFRDLPSGLAALSLATSLAVPNLAGAVVAWRTARIRRLQFLALTEAEAGAATLRQREEALRRSQDRLQAAVVSGQVGIWELDVATLEVWQSPQSRKIIGRGNEPDTSSMQDVVALAHPDDQHLLLEGFQRVLDTGHSVSEIRTGPGSGPPRWVAIEGSLFRDEAGQPVRMAGTLVDVTERRSAEQALRRSERLYRTLARHFPNGVMGLFDVDLRLVLLDGQRSIFGPDPARLVGLRPEEFAPPELASQMVGLMRQALAGEERQVELSHGRMVIDAHFFPIRDEAGKVGMGLFVTEDVTEQRTLQARVAISSRLAAMGTLVTGVAHEINNPLAGQLADQGLALEEVALLRAMVDGDGPLDRADLGRRLQAVETSVHDAQSDGRRIASIVRDLSLFGRPDPRRTRVRLVDVVDDAMRWIQASVHPIAAVQVEDLGSPDVVVSSGQIEQVVVNLVMNGAKAMPADRRGVVRVRLSRGERDTARLEVIDDGTGIPPEVMTRIFDPFFTTRSAGQGMGLGLPICHAIVTAHGGTIAATSTPGQGATFVVELPGVAEGA